MKDGPEREAFGVDINARLEGIKVDVVKKDNKGLRIDLFIQDIETLEELWIDTTCIHPTCKTRLPRELAHTLKHLNWKPSSDESRRPAGQATSDQKKVKHDLYAPLIAIAAKQHMDGIRQSNPKFLAAVTTTLGELGEDTFTLQEWLTKAYRRKLLRSSDRSDGRSHSQLTAIYRNKLRLALQIATAKGQADMLNAAGLPRSCCKKHTYKRFEMPLC